MEPKRKRMRRNWYAMSWSWYQDLVIQAIADEDDAVLKLWPILVAMAKESSSVATNPTGMVLTTPAQLAKVTRSEPKRIEAVLAMLKSAEMVTIDKRKKPFWKITLTAFSQWNTPRDSETDVKRISRKAAKLSEALFAGEKHSTVQSLSPVSPLHIDTYTNTDRSSNELLSTNTSTRQADREAIFFHWCAETGRDPKAFKLTKERRQKIDTRLAEGFTVEQLKAAISFWARDPHHLGQNDRGKAFTDLVTFLRTETKVAQALEKQPEAQVGSRQMSEAEFAAYMGWDQDGAA